MLREGNTRFDDRGVVYLRYGPPDDQIETVTFGIGPNSTWRYHRSTGDLLLHFSGGGEGEKMGEVGEIGAVQEGGDLEDYRLVPSVFSLRAPGGGQWLEFALQDRCPIYPPYCAINGKGAFAQQRIVAEEERLVRTSTAWATTTDANDLRFLHALDASADAVVLGEVGGAPLTHLVVALRFGKSAPPNLRNHELPVRVRFSAFSNAATAGGWIIDTTLQVRSLGGDSLLATGQFMLSLPPGVWQYRVAVESGDSTGRLMAGDSVWSRRLTGGRLELSDLALAEREMGAGWARGPGDTVFFQADRRFDRGAEVDLAYELYGAETEEPIRTELTIRRRGKEKTILTLGYWDIASGPVDRVRRTIDLDGLDAGTYQLEVRAKSAAGRQTRGVVEFEVLKAKGSGGVNAAQP
jgi:hypothetical protein